MFGRIVYSFILYFFTWTSYAQTDTTIANSSTEKTDRFYLKVEKFFHKKRILWPVYSWLFVPNNSNSSDTTKHLSQEISPTITILKKYEGKLIRNIHFKQLEIFGASISDTAFHKPDRIERAGNALHVNTQEWKLRNLLLFKKGDLADADLLRDNERLLRQTPQILDARILVIPLDDYPDEIDILIVVQDNWSLQAEIVDNGFSLSERNFLGLHHEIKNAFNYKIDDDFIEYTGHYRINNIFNTFTNFDFSFQKLLDGDIYKASIGRTFFAPSIKYAGNLAYTKATQLDNRFSFPTDSLWLIPVSFEEQDIWLGRAFNIFSKRKNLTLGGRFINRDYMTRPEVGENTNQIFHNRQLTLFNITYSERLYYREALIYAFGRTEDVPQGRNIVLTTGWDNYEFGRRTYYGIEGAYGKSAPHFGYVSNRIKFGGFRNQKRWEQGELLWQSNYFSNLVIGKSYGFRQFVNFEYQKGINRFEYETQSFNFRSLNYQTKDKAFNTQKITLELEEILFTPSNILGFRTALFANLFGGFWAKDTENIFSNGLFQAYSLGLRLRNERISFNIIEIRFTYYPANNYNQELYFVGFQNTNPLQFRDFDAKAPQTTLWR